MNIFAQLSLILVIAAVLAGLMKVLKQPLIMGYILTGLIIGPYVLNISPHQETLNVFSEMGVSILLFIVGLNLSPKMVKEVGKSIIIAGLVQLIITFLAGLGAATLLGFALVPAMYIGAALSFSSTIIVLKFLGDKKELETLTGRLAIGILLLQDVTAAIVLILASSFSNGHSALSAVGILFLKGLLLTLVLAAISTYFLPKLSDFFAKSQEYLFIFSMAWGFGMASLFKYLGFSTETGALVAGITLAFSPYAREMSSKLKPLRDFFVVIFFVLLGIQLNFSNFWAIVVPALVLILINILGKPAIIMGTLHLLGYSKKVGFITGISLSQISEFSLILILMGVNLGYLHPNTLSLMTFVGLATIAISTYLMNGSTKLYQKLSRRITILNGKKTDSVSDLISEYQVILFGCNRVGFDFIKLFKKLGPEFLAVDYDPEVIKDLQKRNVNCRYGDAEDGEFVDELNLDKAQVVISTIPSFEVNMFLLQKIKKSRRRPAVILISYNMEETMKLYSSGASYVIMPHFIGGQYAAELTKKHALNPRALGRKKQEHLTYLRERVKLGHSHPVWEHH